MDRLANITFENSISYIDLFLKGYHQVKVVKVHDGDTAWVAYQHPALGPFRFKLRFNRIDTAEMKKKKGTTETSEEREQRLFMAKLARDTVISLIEGKVITVNITHIGAYDRPCGDLYLPIQECPQNYISPATTEIVGGVQCMNISNFMLESNLAVLYTGSNQGPKAKKLSIQPESTPKLESVLEPRPEEAPKRKRGRPRKVPI